MTSFDALKDFSKLTSSPLRDPIEEALALEQTLPGSETPAPPFGARMPVKEPSKSTLLLIEDDPIIADALEYLLVREGYKVIKAHDGQTGMELIESMDVPQMILLDLLLPHVDGFHLIEHIRSRPFWSRVPVVMLTANAQERDIVRALNAGANDYVTKPFQLRELVARLKRLSKGAF